MLETVIKLQLTNDDDRYLLRAKLAQEFRHIIDAAKLNNRREITLSLKPNAGYAAEFAFRDEKFQKLILTDIETGDITEIDRFLFLQTQRYLLMGSLG